MISSKNGLMIIALVLFSHLTMAQNPAASIDEFTNKELQVTKLMINEEDLTDKLAKVIITKDQWKEYDHDGKVIGIAKVIKLAKGMVKVEWTQAENGADVGDITLYNITSADSKLHFNIHYDGSNHGYFEVNQ